MQRILIHLGTGLAFQCKLTGHVQIYHTHIHVRIVACMTNSVNYIFWPQNTIIRNVWFIIYTYILNYSCNLTFTESKVWSLFLNIKSFTFVFYRNAF